MAGKPTVTMTLAGDESKLTSAFDKVGASSKQMSDKVESASKSMQDTGKGLDGAIEGFDTVDTRAMDFRDTVTGVSDTLRGLKDESLSTEERLLTLGMGIGDLASGFVNLLLPALGSVWQKLMATSVAQTTLSALQTAGSAIMGVLTTAWHGLNAVMRANPIMTVITIVGLLVGAFVILWNKSAGFRDFFIGMWNGIKGVVGGVVNWIKGAWDGVVGFFGNLPSRIGSALGGLASAAKNVFKGAVNGVVDGLNWFLDHSINWLINKVNSVSGVIGIPAIPTIPHVPRMHTGGVVPGSPGSESMAILQAGERVLPAGQGGGGATVLRSDGSAFADFLLQTLREALRDQGGSVFELEPAP